MASLFFRGVGILQIALIRGSCNTLELKNSKSIIILKKKPFDAPALVIYYHINTGKEVIQKYMSSNHSEVAAA